MTIKRQCSHCGETLPINKFYAEQLRYITTCKCKACYNAIKREKTDPTPPTRPIRHSWELLGMEWRNHEPFDPHNAGNRYEGARSADRCAQG